MKKIDGRKMRWFDCDWDNTSIILNGCGICKVCKYLDFLDYANSVAPAGSEIQRNKEIEAYLDKKGIKY